MRLAGFALILAVCVGASPATQPAKKHPKGTERTIHAMLSSVEAHVIKISVMKKKSEVKERSIRFGSGQAVYRISGGYAGACDPRCDGEAVGF